MNKHARKGIKDFFNAAPEDSYGLMTLDGKKSATGFPFWKDPYAAQEARNKDITKLALDELKKDAHIYFIDEIGTRQAYSNELQDQIMALMEDPSKVVFASVEQSPKEHQYENFAIGEFVKKLDSVDLKILNKVEER